jgi:hypothetical protein
MALNYHSTISEICSGRRVSKLLLPPPCREIDQPATVHTIMAPPHTPSPVKISAISLLYRRLIASFLESSRRTEFSIWQGHNNDMFATVLESWLNGWYSCFVIRNFWFSIQLSHLELGGLCCDDYYTNLIPKLHHVYLSIYGSTVLLLDVGRFSLS